MRGTTRARNVVDEIPSGRCRCPQVRAPVLDANLGSALPQLTDQCGFVSRPAASRPGGPAFRVCCQGRG